MQQDADIGLSGGVHQGDVPVGDDIHALRSLTGPEEHDPPSCSSRNRSRATRASTVGGAPERLDLGQLVGEPLVGGEGAISTSCGSRSIPSRSTALIPGLDVVLLDLRVVGTDVPDEVVAATRARRRAANSGHLPRMLRRPVAAQPEHLGVGDGRRRRSVAGPAHEGQVPEGVERAQLHGLARGDECDLAVGEHVEVVAGVPLPVQRLAGVEALGTKRPGDRIELPVGQTVEDVDPLQVVEDLADAPLLPIAQEGDRGGGLARGSRPGR